jgi:hypothetical protein
MNEGSELRALYYPYSWCLDESFLKRAILYFDTLVFVQAAGPVAPIRRGEAYYQVLGRHGEHLYRKWRWIQSAYSQLEANGLVEYILIEDMPHLAGDTVAAAFYSDLCDDGFVSICEEDTPFGWLVPLDRVGPAVRDARHYDLPITKPYDEFINDLFPRWTKVEQEDTPGGYGKGDNYWTQDAGLGHTLVRRVPHAVGAALYLNQCLLAASERGLFLLTDSIQHHRLLLHKYARTQGQQPAAVLANTEAIAAEIEKHSMVALDILSSFLSEADLSKRSIGDLIVYRNESREPLAALRLKVRQLASEVTSQPWEPKFESEVRRLIDRDLIPELAKSADGLKQVYEKMFGKILGTVGSRLATTSAPTLIASLMAGLSVSQILTMGSASVLSALGLSLPELTDAWHRGRAEGRNSLSFLIGVSDARNIRQWLTVHQTTATAQLLAHQARLCQARHRGEEIRRFTEENLTHIPGRENWERMMLGFAIPERMLRNPIPTAIKATLRKIAGDSHEAIQTRNDARILLEDLQEHFEEQEGRLIPKR